MDLNKKWILFFIVVISTVMFSSCKQDSNDDSTSTIKLVKMKQQEELGTYISHPKRDDEICLSEIEKARKDINSGKTAFCMPSGEGDYGLRQEKYIKVLCKKYGLFFKYEEINDAITKKGRQGCYGAYMDKFLAEKYGEKFKKSVLENADQILIKSNDTIDSYYCDIKPVIKGIDPKDGSVIIRLDSKLKNQLITDNLGYLPVIDLNFFIDKNGIPSGYHLDYFNDNKNNSNEKFKNQLLKIAIEELEKYRNCESGKIKDKNVTTKNRVKVFFH